MLCQGKTDILVYLLGAVGVTAGLALAKRHLGSIAVDDRCKLLAKVNAVERFLINNLCTLFAVPAQAIYIR
jgi:hypothetical protein